MRLPASLLDATPVPRISKARRSSDDATISMSTPFASTQSPSEDIIGQHGVAMIVGVVITCFFITAGCVMVVNGVRPTYTAAMGTVSGLRSRLQERLMEAEPLHASHRRLIQAGMYVANKPTLSPAASASCAAANGQPPSWGNPAFPLGTECTTYDSTAWGGSSSTYSQTQRHAFVVCWGKNVTVASTTTGTKTLSYVGRLSPWTQVGGYYPVDALQMVAHGSNSTQLEDCPRAMVSKLTVVCSCERTLTVSLDPANDPTQHNTTTCAAPDLMVTDPAFCQF